MKTAGEISTAMGIDFNPNTGRLERFKSRKGITSRIISGESASAPKEDATGWTASVLYDILDKYSPANIFNADKTGLFFQFCQIRQ